MRFWFQNLNKNGGRMFYFRGYIGKLRYEFASGPSIRLELNHGTISSDAETTISIGLFFVTVYLSLPLPKKWYLSRKCIATWDDNREFTLTDSRRYGFYFHDWAFVWSFHQKVGESSSQDPWWMRQYIHIDDLFLGRTEYMTRDIYDAEKISFKIGDKEFVMDSIRWFDATWFRRHIPICWLEQKQVRVEMKISKPPMRAGKGENSWDCGDDGVFGVTQNWKHARPTWDNKVEMIRLAISDYAQRALKDAKRYGSGGGEHGIRFTDQFEFVGKP